MIRSRLVSARFSLALWLLTTPFLRFAPRCGRASVGLRAGRRFRLVEPVALCDWGPFGGLLVRFAFWLLLK